MARPSRHDGVVYERNDSSTWWMRYRDKTCRRRLETTNTTDWNEAQRQLRERLQARDNNTVDVVRKGKQTTFDEWADFFLENYSKPPIRAAATHVSNEAALKTLRPVFGALKLSEIRGTDRGTPATSARTAAAFTAMRAWSNYGAPGIPGSAPGL